jgi:hypothetical protein
MQIAVIRLDAGAMAPVSTMVALKEREGGRQWGGITWEGAPEDLAIQSEVLDPSRIRLTGAKLKGLKEVAIRPGSAVDLTIQWDHE